MPRAKRTGSYALGVDGGGSKTLAIVVDGSGHIRGEGKAGSSNHLAMGWSSAARNLRAALAAAVEMAGGTLPLDVAWIGVAGLDGREDVARWGALLARCQPAAVMYLGNDADLLLGALTDAVGVALIAGTGSTAIGRDGSGAMARAGGWGHLLGDEGSGFDLGIQALRAAMRAADGRGPWTALLERSLRFFDVARPEGLLRHVYTRFEKARIARFSREVLAAAREGDMPAKEIADRAAEELTLAALTVADKLAFAEAPVPLALGGGLFAHERDFRQRVLRALRRRRAFALEAVVERPALSAARAARRLAPHQPASVVRLF